jgi:uncharacterized protein
MPFAPPPPTAAWRHHGAREGFEVVFVQPTAGGYRIDGVVSAIENGKACAVRYAIEIDPAWRTTTAWTAGRAEAGPTDRTLATAGDGTWRVDGVPAPHLDGCFDVDLEASAFTNAFPVHRLAIEPGDAADAPAAWVRAVGLGVERLEQRYARIDDDGPHARYDYAAPGLGFETRLVYDESGLVLNYPGIATRVA